MTRVYGDLGQKKWEKSCAVADIGPIIDASVKIAFFTPSLTVGAWIRQLLVVDYRITSETLVLR